MIAVSAKMRSASCVAIGLAIAVIVNVQRMSSLGAEVEQASRIARERIVTPFPIVADVWPALPHFGVLTVRPHFGELDIPACDQRVFHLTGFSEETAEAYAAEVNRLGLDHVGLTGVSARAVKQLLRRSPRVVALTLLECDLTGMAPSECAEQWAQLRELVLVECRGLRDLSFLSQAVNLESLGIRAVERLDVSALTRLHRLRTLRLYEARCVDNIDVLASLEHLCLLVLDNCRMDSVDALSSLTRLRSLELLGCHKIRDIHGLAGLKSLRSLRLSGCDNLRDISALSQITSLEELSINGCELITRLPPLSGLTQLRKLDLSDQLVENLDALPDLASLESLTLPLCDDIRAVGRLRCLRHLSFGGPSGFPVPLRFLGADFSPLSQLTTLESLDLSVCSLDHLPSLAGLKNLQSLSLWGCGNLKELSEVGQLTSLRFLDVRHCDGLVDLSAVSALKCLRVLQISHNQYITDLSFLADLDQLQMVYLSHCDVLADVSALSGLRSLEQLHVHQCENITDWSPLAQLRSLRLLRMSNSGKVVAASLLAERNCLQSLEINGAAGVGAPKRLIDGAPTEFEAMRLEEDSLDLQIDGVLGDPSAISQLRNLRSLVIGDGLDDAAFSFHGLAPLTELRRLEVRVRLRDWPALSDVRNLRKLSIRGDEDLRSAAVFAELKSLEALHIQHSPNLVDLSGLEELQSLTSLSLIGCERVADLSPVKALTKLTSLELWGCLGIRSLSPLWGMSQLRVVDLSRWDAVCEAEVGALRRKLPKCAVLVPAEEDEVVWDLTEESDCPMQEEEAGEGSGFFGTTGGPESKGPAEGNQQRKNPKREQVSALPELAPPHPTSPSSRALP